MKDNRKEIKNLVDETIEDIDTELGIENSEEDSEEEVISEENVKLLVNNLESNISYYDKIVDEEIKRFNK